MKPRVALFADRDSQQIAAIATAIEEVGGWPVVLDLRLGGKADTCSQPLINLSNEGGQWGGVDFDDIGAIHIRGTTPRTLPTFPAVLNGATYSDYRTQFLIEQGFQAATYEFFEHQARLGKLVVNRLTTAYIDHNSKGQFYEKLRSAGFSVPSSLSTNCPEAAARFLDQVGEAVMKPAIGVGSTRGVSADDRTRLDQLLLCPTLFQQRLPGMTIRIHVVGNHMVKAVRLINDQIDSRTHTKDFEEAFLPEATALSAVEATRFLKLHYAAWDGILGHDGRLYLLDCNPGPYVMWLPEAFRRPVFASLARYLVTFARSGSIEAASAAAAT